MKKVIKAKAKPLPKKYRAVMCGGRTTCCH